MTPSLLLTSFDTWLPHQRSNSSDDLLNELLDRDELPENVSLLRRLPVDFQLAPAQVIARIQQLQADAVICCGMAESRQLLTVESNGTVGSESLYTPLDLDFLIQDLIHTSISHDAGRFVCNHLYYSVLQHIQQQKLPTHCLFIHIPVLHDHNLNVIVTDFQLITQRIITAISY